MSLADDALNKFGELLMKDVRDRAIRESMWFIDGKGAAPFSKFLHQKLSSSFSEEQLEFLRYLVPCIVDKAMFYLLLELEQNEWIDVAVTTESGRVPSLRGAGDGMHGDLFSWIPEYSNERKDYLDDMERIEPDDDDPVFPNDEFNF